MIGINRRYLLLRVFLILKCLSVISFLIISAGCRNQKGKLKLAMKKTNKIYLEKPEILIDTIQNVEMPVKIDTVKPVPVYEPPEQPAMDYGVIPVYELTKPIVK